MCVEKCPEKFMTLMKASANTKDFEYYKQFCKEGVTQSMVRLLLWEQASLFKIIWNHSTSWCIFLCVVSLISVYQKSLVLVSVLLCCYPASPVSWTSKVQYLFVHQGSVLMNETCDVYILLYSVSEGLALHEISANVYYIWQLCFSPMSFSHPKVLSSFRLERRQSHRWKQHSVWRWWWKHERCQGPHRRSKVRGSAVTRKNADNCDNFNATFTLHQIVKKIKTQIKK